MMFLLQADDDLTLNTGLVALSISQGIRTRIAKEPYSSEIFQGVWTACPLPNNPRMANLVVY